MKKIYLIIITLFTFAFNAKAQLPPCEVSCVPDSTGAFIDTLCRYNWSGMYNDGVNPPVALSIVNEPCFL